MRFIALCAIIGLATVCRAEILVLDEANFESVVNEVGRYAVVSFYDSKNHPTDEDFDSLFDSLPNDYTDTDVVFGKCDLAANPNIPNPPEEAELPALWLWPQGEPDVTKVPLKHTGGRNWLGVQVFLLDQLQPRAEQKKEEAKTEKAEKTELKKEESKKEEL